MVDLPEPDSPTRPSVSPRPIVNDTPSTAREELPRRAARNSLTRSCTSTSGVAATGRRRRDHGAETGRARHQLPRVVVLRVVEDLPHRALLDDAAAGHHHDPVGAVGGHPEVVGDQQDRGAVLPGQLAEVVEDAALHGDVEGAGRLVGDEQPRVRRDRDRDEHALAHAARELVRVLPGPHGGVGQPGPLQQRDGVQLRGAAVREPVDAQRLGDLVADAGHRVEGDRRVLRDEPDLPPAHGAQRLVRSSCRSGPVAAAGSPGHRRRGRCAGSSPSTAGASVDLPEPDSPTTATTSPGSIVNDTPSTARMSPSALP